MSPGAKRKKKRGAGSCFRGHTLFRRDFSGFVRPCPGVFTPHALLYPNGLVVEKKGERAHKY